MKKHAILTTLILLGVFFTACNKDENVTPSNTVTTIEKNITGYTKLEVSDSFTVKVTFSDTEEKILIEANDNLQGYINVEKQNNRLVIWLDDNINVDGSSTLNIYITTTTINEFSAEGASMIYLENELNAGNIDVELTGACYFSGTVYANNLNATLTGASNLDILGEVDNFDIESEGASNMVDFGFVCNHLNADLIGASNVSATVNQGMIVIANGASNVYYKGDGVIESQDLSGGSTIQKMD